MRWPVLIVGGIATAAMLLISMRLNFLFGFSLGQTPEKAWVFGSVSVISDAWKALGPVFILALFRTRRWPSALGAISIWLFCFCYSVTSALGVAIEDRSARAGNRASLQMNYADTQAEIERLEKKRKALREHRSVPEVEAAINAVFARLVINNHRVRGTVDSVSDHCRRVDSRVAVMCAEISRLQEELAAATEERAVNKRLSELTGQARRLRERGAVRAADPQAELLARLSRGWFAASDVGPGLSILLAVMIELVSAFGAAVLSAYAEATAFKPVKEKVWGLVIDYLAERIQPADKAPALMAGDLYADYQAWCTTRGRPALPASGFLSALDETRIEKGLRKIRKRKDRYYGIRIGASRGERLKPQ